MEVLSRAKTEILKHLGRYKFLTNSQLVTLGVENSRQNINKYVKDMRNRKRKPWVKTATFGVVPKIGKLEGVHFLTKHGKEVLIDIGYTEEILFPKSNTRLFAQDYFHRKYLIDFQIALYKACENKVNIHFFERYFDKVGNNRVAHNLQAKTKIDLKNEQYLISDAIFKLSTSNMLKLYCFEMYNGHDTTRVVKQLEKYLQALELGSASVKYQFPKGFIVLCYFQDDHAMRSVFNRVRNMKDFKYMKSVFLFSSIEQVEKNIQSNWIDLNENQISIF